MPPRKLDCFIEGFLEYTKYSSSPKEFRHWAAISTLSGLAERRLSTRTAYNVLFPNLFVLIVADPGVGKSQAIDRVRFIWENAESPNKDRLYVAPDDMTKASMLDELDKARSMQTLSNGKIYESHPMQICADEFSVLMPAYEPSFLAVMVKMWDCPTSYRESRRTSAGSDMHNLQISMIAGAQPNFLQGMLPEMAWGQGFMARMFMVYSANTVKLPFFSQIVPDTSIEKDLLHDAGQILSLHGEFQWTQEAVDVMEKWTNADCPPVPTHSKLKHYNTRRAQQAAKIAMISSLSRSSKLIVKGEDLQNAINWMTEAETNVPEIFKAMAGASDHAVLEEMQNYVAAQYARTERSVHKSLIFRFLAARTPVNNVNRILEVAINSRLVVQDTKNPDLYIPGDGILGPST